MPGHLVWLGLAQFPGLGQPPELCESVTFLAAPERVQGEVSQV